MNSSQILAEIREANISYLLLAQSLLRTDRAGALAQLGLADEAAQVIEQMTPAQVMKIASINTLLCRFRIGDDLVWDLITSHGTSAAAPADETQPRKPRRSA